MAETRLVWTRQHPEVAETLRRGSIYRVEEAHIQAKNGDMSAYYLELYRWYTREGGRRVPVPEGVAYPIWVSPERESMLQPVEGSVVLTLEVPAELLLVTDMERWGYRVNYWYIPRDKEDERRHNEVLTQNGIGNETALIQTDKGNFYPALRRKITESWTRLFDSPAPGAAVQATLWELHPAWLREVVSGG